MKIKKEVKIGLFAIIVIVVAWWGIKWLKGSNLLSRENTYYAFYEDVAGLQVSSRVWIRGVEVGNVSQIELSGDIVKVSISVKRKYADLITENSTAVIGESGLTADNDRPQRRDRTAGRRRRAAQPSGYGSYGHARKESRSAHRKPRRHARKP